MKLNSPKPVNSAPKPGGGKDFSVEAEREAAALALYVVRGQLFPRFASLALTASSLFSIISSAMLTWALQYLPASIMSIRDTAGIGINIASISMGACISALVLTLALPGEARATRWAKLSGLNGRSQLENLVFTLFFAALCQFAVIIACVTATAFGADLQLSPPRRETFHTLGLLLGFGVFLYGLTQVYVAIATLMQTCVLIVLDERVNH